MLWLEQLELFSRATGKSGGEAVSFPKFFGARSGKLTASLPTVPQTSAPSRRDPQLETEARSLLLAVGSRDLAKSLRVIWNPRLRSAAGRADFRLRVISLNPRLQEHGTAEIDRTLRHELAHLLAHSRCGRRQIAPHGGEWQQACADLGIAGESRCHTLPFPVTQRARRYLYRCPRCAREFPRVRRIRRRLACLACCRAYNRGAYEPSAQLRLVSGPKAP